MILHLYICVCVCACVLLTCSCKMIPYTCRCMYDRSVINSEFDKSLYPAILVTVRVACDLMAWTHTKGSFSCPIIWIHNEHSNNNKKKKFCQQSLSHWPDFLIMLTMHVSIDVGQTEAAWSTHVVHFLL